MEKWELMEKFTYEKGKRYKLKHEAIPETIRVITDEPYTAVREFVYYHKTNEVEILNDKINPKEINIRYQFWKDH